MHRSKQSKDAGSELRKCLQFLDKVFRERSPEEVILSEDQGDDGISHEDQPMCSRQKENKAKPEVRGIWVFWRFQGG